MWADSDFMYVYQLLFCQNITILLQKPPVYVMFSPASAQHPPWSHFLIMFLIFLIFSNYIIPLFYVTQRKFCFESGSSEGFYLMSFPWGFFFATVASGLLISDL